jgi:hypothetical protein
LTLQELGIDGHWTSENLKLVTKSHDFHLIINEIMANPAGKEPDQEWVELYNDSPRTCNVQGFRFADAQSPVELPETQIPGGSFALLVNSSFNLQAMETAPPSVTTIIRLKSLGKNGLSNSGEEVRLIGPDGSVLSSVPALASPKQDCSVERIDLDGPDDRPASFRISQKGGSPGLPNNHSN